MKKKILLLDTNFSAKPIYDYLVNTGADVFVIGRNPNDVLAKSVKNYINIDYSKINEVRSLIETLSIDYIVPGGNDLSYKICSKLNDKYGFYNLDHIKITNIINNKEKFRKIALKYGLHVPRIIKRKQYDNFANIIVKPVDSYSGHGMTVLSQPDDEKINNAVKYAIKFSQSQKYFIEEYVQGQLFSHSAFISNGKIMVDFIVKEYCIVNQFVVDTSHLVYSFDQNILDQIRFDISTLVKKLNLVDGLIHTQFIFNGISFWIIEVTRRCPGDLYSKLIQFSTDFPYAEYYAKPFLNEKNRFTNIKKSKSLILRHTISLRNERYFNSITVQSPIHILSFIPISLTGDKIKASPYSRIGLIFLYSNSKSDFNNLLNKTINRKLYSVN